MLVAEMDATYKTLKATLRRRVDLAESNRVFERWAATKPRGSVGRMVLRSDRGTAHAEPEPDVVVQTSRLWLASPSRWRFEVDVPDGVAFTVVDGPLWWAYAPSLHAISNVSATEASPPSREHPEWHLFHPRGSMRGLAVTNVRIAEFLGRSVEVIQARPEGDADPRLPLGADGYEFAIDRERGVALRITALTDGHEFSSIEVTSIEYDAPLGPDVFRVDVPRGVVFTPPPPMPRPRRTLLSRIFGR